MIAIAAGFRDFCRKDFLIFRYLADAIFGKRFISAKPGDPNAPVIELEVTIPVRTLFEGKHWCFSEERRFCIWSPPN